MITISAPTAAEAATLAARLQVVDLAGELCILNVDKVIALRFNDRGKLSITHGHLMSEGRKVYYQSEQVSATLDTTQGFFLDTPANRARLRAQLTA